MFNMRSYWRHALILTVLVVQRASSQTVLPCDSTILVEQKLADSVDVRAAFPNWVGSQQPVELLFTKPQLKNSNATGAALLRNYPPNLRDRGIGGEVRVAMLIDVTGKPSSLAIVKSSGIPDLDNAAEQTAAVMRWKPGISTAGCAAPMILQIPIMFRTLR